jgi:predicted ATP-grasp superfamily ATP-dependent carboligase
MQLILIDDGGFRYLGGAGPLPPDKSARARSLAVRAVSAVLQSTDEPVQRCEFGEQPPIAAYFGVDLVLADDPASDVVIEINPRLTTSYVGLRQLVDGNLAAAMLDLASGDNPTLSWRAAQVQFDPSGNATLVPSP